MPKFVIPPWREKLIRKKFLRKNRVINQAVVDSERVMMEAIEMIMSHGLLTNHFNPPSLHELDAIFEKFYRSVIEEAYHDYKEQKSAMVGKKRLSKLPFGLPTTLRGLEKIFRDRRYWPTIMKRSKMIVDKMRKSYLFKLQRKFKELLPKIRENEITPFQAKKKMMEVWEASKARVTLIFRTETTTYFGKTQVAFFKKDPDIIGFLYDSVRDTARTDICRTRHGMIYRRDHTGKESIAYNSPSLHYNCRSHLIPLANTPENVKMMEDERRDPVKNRSKIAPLLPGWRPSTNN